MFVRTGATDGPSLRRLVSSGRSAEAKVSATSSSVTEQAGTPGSYVTQECYFCTRIPAASRSHVSGVTPLSLRTFFLTFALAVLGISEMYSM